MSRRLDQEEIARQLEDLPGWELQGESLHAELDTPDFRTAVALVTAVADEAEQMDHHPDIDIRYRRVHLTLSTHSAGGITQLDIELAHRIEEQARRLGASVPQRG